MSDQHLELEGVVTEMSRGSFKVQVTNAEGYQIINAKLSGKLRLNKINVMVQDTVRVKVSVYDTSNGFIVRRLK